MTMSQMEVTSDPLVQWSMGMMGGYDGNLAGEDRHRRHNAWGGKVERDGTKWAF